MRTILKAGGLALALAMGAAAPWAVAIPSVKKYKPQIIQNVR